MSRVEGDNFDVRWPRHAEPGTLGFELIEGLPAITDYDSFFWSGLELDMHPYGACYHDFAQKLSTGVIEFLKSRGIETILVGGLVTDHCIKTTVIELLKAGFKTMVNLSACRGIAQDTTLSAINEMTSEGAIIIDSIDELSQP